MTDLPEDAFWAARELWWRGELSPAAWLLLCALHRMRQRDGGVFRVGDRLLAQKTGVNRSRLPQLCEELGRALGRRRFSAARMGRQRSRYYVHAAPSGTAQVPKGKPADALVPDRYQSGASLVPERYQTGTGQVPGTTAIAEPLSGPPDPDHAASPPAPAAPARPPSVPDADASEGGLRGNRTAPGTGTTGAGGRRLTAVGIGALIPTIDEIARDAPTIARLLKGEK